MNPVPVIGKKYEIFYNENNPNNFFFEVRGFVDKHIVIRTKRKFRYKIEDPDWFDYMVEKGYLKEVPMTTLQKKLRQFAEGIAQMGGRAFFVGGCVRDEIMGKESDDIDIAVQGLPFEKILEAIAPIANKVTPEAVGGRFAVLIADIEGNKIDIALCRGEKKVGEGHQGFEVNFNVTIIHDLYRRDFTKNAIAKDILTGDLIDPFDGVQHIADGILHPVSEAFLEDDNRVFRAARFFSRFRFHPTDQLIGFCKRMNQSTIPVEAIGAEFKKVVEQSDFPFMFFEFLESVGWIDPIFTPFKGIDWFEVEFPDSFVGKMMTILLQISAKEAEKFLWSLKTFDKQTIKKWMALHKADCNATSLLDEYILRTKMRELQKAEATIEELLSFIKGSDADKAKVSLVAKTIDLQPIVTGEDLIAAGFKPGPRFKDMLALFILLQDSGELTKEDKATLFEQEIKNF